MPSLSQLCGPRFSVVIGVLVLFVILPSYGQSPPTTSVPTTGAPISLRDALTRALEANPNLRGQRFAISAAAARIDQAALRPPLEVGVDAENIVGTNRLSTFDDAEISLRLGTVLELGDKRARRVEAASSERDLLLNQNDAERLDILAEVARRFIRVATLQEERLLAQRRADLATRTLESVQQRVTAARSPLLESRNASIAQNRAQIELSQAEAAVRQAWGQLAAMWGIDPSATGQVSADLFALPATSDFSVLATLLEKNPDLIRFASERRIQDARLRLAQAQRAPDLTMSAGVRRLQGERSNALLLSASIPLGAASRATPYISEAQSLRDGLQYREQATRAELLATLYNASEQLAQRRSEISTLATLAIPQAAEAQKLAEDGYQVGRFSLLELITAQQQLTDLQRQAIDAAAAFHESLLEIERLTGRNYGNASLDATNVEINK